jgi:uncharacterized protein with HEPN domain
VSAKNIPEEIRARYPEIPWNRVVGLRNIVVHGYFVVDLEIKSSCPGLKKFC